MLLLFLLITFLGMFGDREFLWRRICEAGVTHTFGDCLALELPLAQFPNITGTFELGAGTPPFSSVVDSPSIIVPITVYYFTNATWGKIKTTCFFGFRRFRLQFAVRNWRTVELKLELQQKTIFILFYSPLCALSSPLLAEAPCAPDMKWAFWIPHHRTLSFLHPSFHFVRSGPLPSYFSGFRYCFLAR